MIYFLIPAYNEAVNLPGLSINLSKYVKQQKLIIIIDDGSTDNTREVITKLSKTYPVKRIGYKKNQGAGYAFKFGFKKFIPNLKSDDLVITMEADNTSDYSKLEKMIQLAKIHEIVLASPHKVGGAFKSVSLMRTVLSKISSQIDSMVFGINNVKTYTSFYRVYNARLLKQLNAAYGNRLVTNNGFNSVIEILLKANRLGADIVEIPAEVDWEKRLGKSKMNILKNAKGHLSLYRDYYLGKFT